MFLIILGAEIKHVKWSTQWRSFHCPVLQLLWNWNQVLGFRKKLHFTFSQTPRRACMFQLWCWSRVKIGSGINCSTTVALSTFFIKQQWKQGQYSIFQPGSSSSIHTQLLLFTTSAKELLELKRYKMQPTAKSNVNQTCSHYSFHVTCTENHCYHSNIVGFA